MVRLLKEYRSKFSDFEKALKNSRQAYKKYVKKLKEEEGIKKKL